MATERHIRQPIRVRELQTHFGSHHTGLNSLKRLGHLVSSRVFMDTSSTSSLPSSFLTCRSAGSSAKWTVGAPPALNMVENENMPPVNATATMLIKAPL